MLAIRWTGDPRRQQLSGGIRIREHHHMDRTDSRQTRPAKPKVALLIDADNIRCVYRHEVERCARRYGELAVCLGFGVRPVRAWSRDGALPHLDWDEPTGPDGGRNAADNRLIEAAMALLEGGGIDCFCIVSNDGDFAPLASRVRAAGKLAIGIGHEGTSSARLREACTVFETVGRNVPTAPGIPLEATSVRAEFPELVALALGEDAREWTKASVLGVRLRAVWPGIDYRRYGETKLGALLHSYPAEFETRCEHDVLEFRMVAR